MIASRIMQVLGTDTIHLVDKSTGRLTSMRFLEYLDTRNDETVANTLAFTSAARATLESMRILERIVHEN